MNLKFVRKNILFIFLFLSFLILGILVLTNYFSVKKLETGILNQYDTHRDLLLEKAALNIEKDINSKKSELNGLDKKIILDEIISNSCSDILFTTKKNILINLENYFVIDDKGKIISCTDSNYLDYLNLNIKDTNYFKEVSDSKKTIIKYIQTSSPGQLYLLTPISVKENKFNAVALLSIIEIKDLYSKYIHELISNENYYYLLDKTNSNIIMKSETLNNSLINIFKEKAFQKSEFLTINENIYVFNKKQLKVGNDIWEIGVLSSTKEIEDMFSNSNKKHLISLFFILIILGILFVILIKLFNLKENVENKLKKAEMTLENFGIKMDYEISNSKSFSENKLINGFIYFIRDDFEQAHELFVKGIIDKRIGLGFLKEEIDNFKKKYNLDKTSFIRLGTDTIQNSKYKTVIKNRIIFKIISEFLDKNKEPKIILIDHLDFIIFQNSFESVLSNLYELKEKIKMTNSILIFSLNQNAISNRNLLALEKEFIDIETEEKKLMKSISKLEHEILVFINNSNNNKLEVRYKDISKKFEITKPTTSKKIKELERKNLILTKDLGRRKVIEITQKGRKII